MYLLLIIYLLLAVRNLVLVVWFLDCMMIIYNNLHSDVVLYTACLFYPHASLTLSVAFSLGSITLAFKVN